MRISDWSSDVCSSDLDHAGPCLGALRRPADLRLAGEDRSQPAGGGHRSRRRAGQALPARHPAPVAARHHRRLPHRLHPDGRRLCHPQAGRRPGAADDRQHHPGAVRQGEQLAARCRARHLHDGHRRGRFAAVRCAVEADHRTVPIAGRRQVKLRPLGIYALLYLAFLYVPVLFLPVFSFNDSAIVTFPLEGITTRWYQNLWANDAMHGALWNSLKVGVATSVTATVLGICGARALTRYRFPGRAGIAGLIMLPLVLPEILVAISLLVVLLQLGFDLSLFSVILGHILMAVPFSIAVLSSSFEGFDRSLEEASLDLGEGPAATFFRVTLPIVSPGIDLKSVV